MPGGAKKRRSVRRKHKTRTINKKNKRKNKKTKK
uniref:Uncharacterized protein n=1 Tax=viral metagenome TaxID=1070528 RepID=A0A6C0F835_9ZZZZ